MAYFFMPTFFMPSLFMPVVPLFVEPLSRTSLGPPIAPLSQGRTYPVEPSTRGYRRWRFSWLWHGETGQLLCFRMSSDRQGVLRGKAGGRAREPRSRGGVTRTRHSDTVSGFPQSGKVSREAAAAGWVMGADCPAAAQAGASGQNDGLTWQCRGRQRVPEGARRRG
jgi:hypothetical protein